MQPLTQFLAPWHDFYELLGTASATMIGLLFVAVSVGSGIFSRSRRGAQRMFLSASVVGFGVVLAISLFVMAPHEGWGTLGTLVMAAGIFGLGYSAVTWADAVRDGLVEKIDLEDRLWYALGPATAYLVDTVAGVMLMMRMPLGCRAMAVAMGILALVSVHNAWDITIWSVTRNND
jgi:hypothetical protein